MKTVVRRRTPGVHVKAGAPTGELVLERAGDGRLLAVQGQTRHVVHVGRCFPWSEPTSYFSLRDDDGNEIALVANPADLEDSSRQALEGALAEADFVFDVTGVVAIEEEVELRHWRVHTSQGDRTFQTRLDDWPRLLPGGGLIIRDVTGDLYRLSDPRTMDRQSRSLLWAFVD
jgi:Domain of unknown function (DUF1854)